MGNLKYSGGTFISFIFGAPKRRTNDVSMANWLAIPECGCPILPGTTKTHFPESLSVRWAIRQSFVQRNTRKGYAGLLGPPSLWAPPTKTTLETGDRQPQDGRSLGLRMTAVSCPLTRNIHTGLYEREITLGESCNCLPVSSCQGLIMVPDHK